MGTHTIFRFRNEFVYIPTLPGSERSNVKFEMQERRIQMEARRAVEKHAHVAIEIETLPSRRYLQIGIHDIAERGFDAVFVQARLWRCRVGRARRIFDTRNPGTPGRRCAEAPGTCFSRRPRIGNVEGIGVRLPIGAAE